jgi:putative AdoMet-dependent methyltransferase
VTLVSEAGDERLRALRAEFDEWADRYEADLEHPEGVLVGHADARRLSASLLTVRPDDVLVDLGVGTGLFAECFDGGGATVIGVDLSPRMLARCAEKHPAWQYAAGHFLAIPLPDHTADAVISAFASHHLDTDEWPDALREVMRVLKPAGKFLLVDILFVDEETKDEARRILGEAWEEENYPVYTHLGPVAAELGLRATFTALTPLHAAVLFEGMA